MNLKQIWASIVAWWISWTARWRKPQPTSTVLEVIPEPLAVEPEPQTPEPEPDTCTYARTYECTVQEVPLEEFEVAVVEPDVIVPSIPIDLEFIEPPAAEVVEEPPSELQRAMAELTKLLIAREHYQTTGSCNADVPRQDCRAAGPLQDCRVIRPRNSRVPHN
jgi:hypothetical protein